MMTDQWDGRPLNPEADGEHVFLQGAGKMIRFWRAADQSWWYPGSAYRSPASQAAAFKTWRYLHPLIKPADHAASVSAAVEGVKAACENVATKEPASAYTDAVSVEAEQAYYLGYASAKRHIADAIRALPLPASDALAERDARMRREGMEQAATIIERLGEDYVELSAGELCETAVAAIRRSATAQEGD